MNVIITALIVGLEQLLDKKVMSIDANDRANMHEVMRKTNIVKCSWRESLWDFSK